MKKRTLDLELEDLSLSSLTVTSHKAKGKTLNLSKYQFLQPMICVDILKTISKGL